MAWLIALLGLFWLVFWLWVWRMAFWVLRWTYLEKKADRKTPPPGRRAKPAVPPGAVTTRVW